MQPVPGLLFWACVLLSVISILPSLLIIEHVVWTFVLHLCKHTRGYMQSDIMVNVRYSTGSIDRIITPRSQDDGRSQRGLVFFVLPRPGVWVASLVNPNLLSLSRADLAHFDATSGIDVFHSFPYMDWPALVLLRSVLAIVPCWALSRECLCCSPFVCMSILRQ